MPKDSKFFRGGLCVHVCPDHLRGAFHLCLTLSGVVCRVSAVGQGSVGSTVTPGSYRRPNTLGLCLACVNIAFVPVLWNILYTCLSIQLFNSG